MQENKKIIFRSDSWRRYLERQEATVFPRLAAPRSLATLWMLLALIIATSLAILSKKAPTYSPGLAIARANGGMDNGDADFTILLSGQPKQAFHAGNSGLIEFADNTAPIMGSVIKVENSQIGLSEAMTRFGLSAETFASIRFPASVVNLRVTSTMTGGQRQANHKVVYQAQVQNGTKRAISYVISATTR